MCKNLGGVVNRILTRLKLRNMIQNPSNCSDPPALSDMIGKAVKRSMRPLAIIVARSLNDVIGCSNELPWRQKDDLRRFRKITLGKPVIIGRRTYESIGRPLDGRLTIVMSRNVSFVKGLNTLGDNRVVGVLNADEAIDRSNDYIRAKPDTNEVMIAGGQEIFDQFLPHVSKVYLTRIDVSLEGDAYFRDSEYLRRMNCETIGHHPADGENDFPSAYFEYKLPVNRSYSVREITSRQIRLRDN